MEKSKERDLRFDLIKTIAIFGVLIIHTCGYNYPVRSVSFLSTVFWRSLAGASVPLFLMCSGALLIEPEKPLTLKKLYFKNMLRIVVACFFWAFIYKVYWLVDTETLCKDSFIYAVKEVLLFKHEFHLYYVQIILIVYALLPILRAFAKSCERKELLYALAVWFVLGILYPTVRDVWPIRLLGGVTWQWWLNMTYASVGYSLLGYYMKKYPPSKRAGMILTVLGFLVTFGLTMLISVHMGVLYERLLEGFTVGIALLASGIYGLCMHVETSPGVCTIISKSSYSVYLIHMLCIYLVLEPIGLSAYSFNPFFSVPLIAAANLVLCLCVYFILSHISGIRKWLV